MFTLTLVTPEKKIETDIEIDELLVPGYRGELNILPGHAPLMTTLKVGELKYKPKGENDFKSVVLSWGYCQVFPGGINILADTAEVIDEIDLDRAQEALKKSQERLKMAGLPVEEVIKLQRKELRAKTRLEMAKKK